MADSKLLIVSSSPHIRIPETTDRIMKDVQFALLPAVVASVLLFGFRALGIIFVSVVFAILTELVYQRLTKQEVTITDGSAAVTGLLLAMVLPPTVPLWLPAVGAIFAIVIVKQLFGGLGDNFLNPALAARAMLLAAWPALMTSWVTPQGIAAATPLVGIVGKTAEAATVAVPNLRSLFLGYRAGSLGETSVLALLLGGTYLIWQRIIDWRIPASFIATVGLMSWIFGGDPLLHVLSGGLILGAFFMATDYVTSPVTPRGRIIFGIGCGIITVMIRLWGGYPEGVCYSILIMNIVTPLIDKFTAPRIFGEVRAK
ncbi:MAG: RnfABCDGE type electron transport complex subunit D [Chloroflexota bacterium]